MKRRSEIHNVLALHTLNHVLTSVETVTKNNELIKKLTKRQAVAEALLEQEQGSRKGKTKKMRKGVTSSSSMAAGVVEDDDKWRDQGFTRPKVLLLFPTRGTAHKFVTETLFTLLGGAGGESVSVDNRERFDKEYGPAVDDNDDDEIDDKENNEKERVKRVLEAKGPDWNELFGDDTNADDNFKLGMNVSFAKLTKKEKGKTCSVQLYSEFYKSDIILASPLGLKMALEDEENDKGRRNDIDFLSSIEIVTVFYADVILMQNWDHLDQGVLPHLNNYPKNNDNDTDFSRVREYFLREQQPQDLSNASNNGNIKNTNPSRYYRQTILISRFNDPHILSTFRKESSPRQNDHINIPIPTRRCAVVTRQTSSKTARIATIQKRGLRQVFQRLPCSSPRDQTDARLTYFTTKILPTLQRTKKKGVLIYTPSYFDYVALRNELLRRELGSSFVSVTEYSRVSEVSRGRARFFQGRKRIMLYTGRAHFFRRRLVRGARHLIFYGIPEHDEFYAGMVDALEDGDGDGELEGELSCLTLFTRYDGFSLERIVGRDHCERMVCGEKSTFLFC